MEFWKALVLSGVALLFASGIYILVLSVLSPETLKRPGVRWCVTGRHPDPTPVDQRIMGGFAVAAAIALLLSTLGIVANAGLAILPLWGFAILLRSRLAKARACMVKLFATLRTYLAPIFLLYIAWRALNDDPEKSLSRGIPITPGEYQNEVAAAFAVAGLLLALIVRRYERRKSNRSGSDQA
jgi:hypothetical protein